MAEYWDWVIFFGFAIFFAGFGTLQKIKNFTREQGKHPSLETLRSLTENPSNVESRKLERGLIVYVPKNKGKAAGKRKQAVCIMQIDEHAVLTSPKDRHRTYRRHMSELSF